MSSGWQSEASSCHSEEKEEVFLPTKIGDKNYLKDDSIDLDDAEEELWKDLEEEDLLEEKFIKYIFIDTETGKPYIEMPSQYHYGIRQRLRAKLDSQSTTTSPVLVATVGSIELNNNVKKEPNVLIYGPKRFCSNEKFINKVGRNNMNPNAIIEVSWTNKMEAEERKFRWTMRKHKKELGIIKVGYLIKPQPRSPNAHPTKNNPDRPLVGIDVYRMESTDEEPTMVHGWRHGDDHPEDLRITAEELGQGDQGEGLSFSLTWIIDELTRNGVVFEEPCEN